MKKWKREGNFTPNAQFRIFTSGLNKKYHLFNENSTAMINEITVTAKRKRK
jgi:hypothetical protein